MRRSLQRSILLSMALVGLNGSSARADLISGNFDFVLFPETNTGLGLLGSNFELHGFPPGSAVRMADCTPCIPGEVINFGITAGPNLGSGFGTIAGMSYADLTIVGELSFNPEDFTVPAMPGQFGADGTFRIDLQAFSSGRLVFDELFSGRTRGAAISFGALDGSQFRINAVGFSFPQPIPEPTTLLLVATGIGGALVARRRTRGSPVARADHPDTH